MSTPQPLSGMLAHALLAPWLQWLSETRLYQLEAVGSSGASDEAFQDALSDLMVERFVLHEALSEPFVLELQVLSLRADLPLKALHGRPVRLGITLADGQRSHRSGYITSASALDADGGLARYQLRVQPWPALLNATLASRVWQERTVIEIIDDVFTDHQGVAAWRWDADVPAHVRGGLYARFGGQRPYCVQYRETDLAFVQRLLAEEGMGWRVEETPADDHHTRPPGATPWCCLPAAPHSPKTPAAPATWADAASATTAAAARRCKTASRPWARCASWAPPAPWSWVGTARPSRSSTPRCPPTTNGAAPRPAACSTG